MMHCDAMEDVMIEVVKKVCPLEGAEFLSEIAEEALLKAGINVEDDDAYKAITAVQDATVIAVHCPTCEHFDGCQIANS